MERKFKVKNIIDIDSITADTEMPTSDFLLQTDKKLVQWTLEKTKGTSTKVSPGIYKMEKTAIGFSLTPSSFVKDKILEGLTNTVKIENVIDTFFQNIPLYYELGIEIPKRNLLLYGTQGTGKSVAISKAMEKYQNSNDTAILVWDTNTFESFEVKSFISTFEYVGVSKFILICEDLGGTNQQEVRVRSDSSLLSLLDNNTKTFTIPVMVIATTNYPQALDANIANRAGRFDDKIEISPPTPEQRKALLLFYHKEATEAQLALIADKKCSEVTPASIKEIYIRSRIRNESIESCIQQVLDEDKLYKKGFSKQKDLGF